MRLNNQYILGLDPGNKGACALLSLDGKELDWFKLPTRVALAGTGQLRVDAFKLYPHLENFDIVACYIEMQKGKNAVLNANYGICLAVLDLLEIPLVAMHPASWMKSLKTQTGLDDIKQGTEKAFTFYAFENIFPDITLPDKGRKKDDDIADAALLAYLCYLNIERERD